MIYEKYLSLLSRIIIGIGIIIFLFPIIWFLLASFKTPKDMYDIGSFNINLYNYFQVFKNYPIGLYIKNSLVLAIASAIIAVSIGTLAAYGISQTNFKFKKETSIFVYIVRLIPSMAIIVPLFLVFNQLNLLNTYPGLVLAHTIASLPLIIIIMIGYFVDLPRELIDSGYIDGCNRINIIYYIVIPLVKPGVSVCALFAFLVSWNNFDISLLIGYMPEYKTMPLGLAMMNTQYGILWNLISAAGALYIIPMVILAVSLQKYVIKGLTAGALKG